MTLKIDKEDTPDRVFVLGRALHLDKDDKVVEEDNPASVRVLGGEGSVIAPENVKKYGLDESHRLTPTSEAETPTVPMAAVTEPEPVSEPEPEPVAKPKGKKGEPAGQQ